MSDTPRTDALLARYDNTTAAFSYLGDLEKHARQLERENNRLREALKACVAEKESELASFQKNLGRPPLVMPAWLEQARSALAAIAHTK